MIRKLMLRTQTGDINLESRDVRRFTPDVVKRQR
jgi:hypothetical protein